MRYRVIFSPEADAQLVGIYRYIAGQASPMIAERFTTAIVDYCEAFDTFPHRGAKRDDLRPGLLARGKQDENGASIWVRIAMGL